MDFSQFGQDTTFNPEEVLASSGGVLPDMTGAVLTVLGFEDKTNQSGWQAVSYELAVADDGGDGSLNGRTFKYQITVANPSFPDAATWGFDELKRWAAALGLTSLGSAQDFVGGSFMCNIGKKAQKNDPTNFNQTIKAVKPVATSAPRQAQPQPQQGGFNQPKQGGFQQPAQGGFQQKPAFQGGQSNATQGLKAPQQKPQQATNFDDFDDDIPF